MTHEQLWRFVSESNQIEGITRVPSDEEMDASSDFLRLRRVHVADLERFVSVCAPGARLRKEQGMNVAVGRHIAPPGGPQLVHALELLLERANSSAADPFSVHVDYETLHPFMDGNGRSGRILWAWMMNRDHDRLLDLGFLHAFYYQTLSSSRKEK